MSDGRVAEVIGAVVDVEFPQGFVPKGFRAPTTAEVIGSTVNVYPLSITGKCLE